MVKSFKNSILLVGLAAVVSGCAAREIVDNYPLREIDRPYTLPFGMKSWGIQAGAWSEGDDPDTVGEESTGRGFVNPFLWETPVSDKVSVVWWPLPLGLKWQITKDKNDRVGLTVIPALFYNWAELAYRRHFQPNHAFEISYEGLEYDFIFFEGSERKIRLGYLWQFNDEQYFKLGAAPGVLRGDSDFFESIFEGIGTSTGDLQYEVKAMTFDVGWGYRLSKQWNLDLDYIRTRAREDESTFQIAGQAYGRFNVRATHFW